MRGLLTRGRSAAITIAVPCRSDEPGLGRTLEALETAVRPLENRGHLVSYAVCVNGPSGSAQPVAEAFAAGRGKGRTHLLMLPQADKATAWNALRGACQTEWLLFCDADVRPAQDSLVRLAEALEESPDAAVATARLEPEEGGETFVSRAASLPHRFDFGVIRGPLYLLRAEALVRMPEGLLFEDAWLSAELGSRGAGSVLSVWPSVVYYRPPSGLQDYLRERLRTEAGKIQIRQERLRRGIPQTPIARYPWQRFVAELGPREWPLVVLNLSVRACARLCAELAQWRGREVPWTPVASSKSPDSPPSTPGSK